MRSWLVVAVLLVLVAAVIGEAGAVGKVTQDPNVGGAAEEQSVKTDPLALDERLDRRVTYWSTNECVSSILGVVGELAGAKLYCGENNDDWQVRDRKMNVFATDVPLRDLMRSIARVMKYRWRVNDEKSPWTYRLYMGSPELLEAQELQKKQEREYERRMAEKRAEFLDKYMGVDSLSEAEVEKLKETDPRFYIDIAAGTASPFAKLLREAPQFKDAFLAGRTIESRGSELAPAAQKALIAFVRGIVNWFEMEKRLHQSSASTWAVPRDIERRVGELRVSLYVSRGIDEAPELPGMSLGSMIVVMDKPDKQYPGDYEGYFPFLMDDTQCDFQRIDAKRKIEAWDKNKKLNEVFTWQDMVDSQVGIAKLRHAVFSEPLIEHSEDSAPVEKVVLKPAGDHLTDVEQALADVSSLAVVSDNFGASSLCAGVIPTWEVTVRQALDKIGTAYNYNWDIHEKVIELRDRQWFRKRCLQLPEAQLARWRNTYEETGTLDIDDLAQLARLDPEQYRANIIEDSILGSLGLERKGNATLKAYGLLNDDQRAALFSEDGLNLGVFCAEPKIEHEVLLPLREWFDGKRSPRTARGKRLYAKGVKKGKVYEYTFRAVADDTSLEPLEWKLTTPEYKGPDQPENS